MGGREERREDRRSLEMDVRSGEVENVEEKVE